MAARERVNCKLLFAAVTAGFGSGFQHGYHLGVINVPEEVLRKWMKATYEKRTGKIMDSVTGDLLWGTVTSIMMVGAAIGASLTGVFARKLGPKLALTINNVLVIVAVVLMALSKLAETFTMLVVGRFVIGINCGLNAGLCPMYLSEIPPVGLRGAIGSVYQLVISMAILTAQILGLDFIFGNSDLWPYLFVVAAIVSVFQMVALFFCCESPHFLVTKRGDLVRARNALKWLRNTDDVDEEMSAIEAADDAVKELPKVTLKELFRNSALRKPLIVAVVVMIAQQFCGISTVAFYSTATFKHAGLEGNNPKFATIGLGIVYMLMTFTSLFLVDIYGRRTLLLVCFGGMTFTTFSLTVGLTLTQVYNSKVLIWICIVFFFIFVIFFAAGAGGIPWVLASELFNQAARPTAVSIVVAFHWIANFFVTLTFPAVESQIKGHVYFIFFISNILFFVFIFKRLPETKNKTIEEITQQFT